MVAQIDRSYAKIRPTKVITRLLSYALFEGRPLTTRGRWINPLIFALFSIEKALPQIKSVSQPIYIVGTGRSGTTLLGLLLSIHKDVAYLNEPKAMWHSIYPEEDLIGSYSMGNAYYKLSEDDVNPEVMQNAHKLYGVYSAATLSRRIVEKYPELIFRVPFIKKIFPDAKFIFLVRNGWDTCHSITQWSERLGKTTLAETHDWWGVNNRKWKLIVDQIIPENPDLFAHIDEIRDMTNHTDMAAVEWIVTMREGVKLVDEMPNDILQVRYEELTSRSHSSLEQIAKYCELSHDKKYIRYGLDVLRPGISKAAFKLHPAINDAFINTMEILGYRV